MPANESIEFYPDGKNVTCRANGAVTGKRFVKVAGPRADGLIDVSTCGAGEKAFGVSGYDAADNAILPTHGPGKIVPVTTAAAVTANDQVQSDATGKAIPLAAPVAASLNTGLVASNNAITWTARETGTAGNSLTVTIVDPGGTTASLSVDVDGNDIIVSLARAASAISSTADDVKAAVLEHDTASQLVTTVDTSTSDGTGLMTALAQTNLAGGSAGSDVAVPNGLALDSALSGADVMVRIY